MGIKLPFPHLFGNLTNGIIMFVKMYTISKIQGLFHTEVLFASKWNYLKQVRRRILENIPQCGCTGCSKRPQGSGQQPVYPIL